MKKLLILTFLIVLLTSCADKEVHLKNISCYYELSSGGEQSPYPEINYNLRVEVFLTAQGSFHLTIPGIIDGEQSTYSNGNYYRNFGDLGSTTITVSLENGESASQNVSHG